MKLTGTRCQCTACGRYFSTAKNFDRHRTGEYRPGARLFGRSCKPVETLPGWRQDKRGAWTRDRPRPETLAVTAAYGSRFDDRQEAATRA